MAERKTALANQQSVIDDKAGILIEEMPIPTIVQLDVWPGQEDGALDHLLGSKFLRLDTMRVGVKKDGKMPEVRQVVSWGAGIVARLTPERFLLTCGVPVRLEFREETGSAFDLSHARCCLRISGEGVEHVLAKGAVLDFSVAGFPVDTVAQTMAHHMDLTIIRRSETEFDILAFRGFAESLLDHLMDAANEFGVSFRPFSPPT